MISGKKSRCYCTLHEGARQRQADEVASECDTLVRRFDARSISI